MNISQTNIIRSNKDIRAVKHYLSLGLIILFGTFLRFFLLTNQSLWYDEGISLVLSDRATLQENFVSLWDRPGGDKYQPLYYLLLSVWRSLFGHSEFALRLFSVIPGIAAILLVYLLVQRIYGKYHALWSTLLISTSAFCIYYSQEVRPYSLQLCLAALQLYLFSRLLTRKKYGVFPRLFFGVITGLNCFGGILLAVFSFALCLSHIAVYRRFREWLQWWIPAGIFSIPTILYFLSTPAAGNPSGDSTNGLGFPIYKNAIFSLYGLLVGTTYGPPLNAFKGENSIKQSLLNYVPHLLVLIFLLGVLAYLLLTCLWKYSRYSKGGREDFFFTTLLITSFLGAVAIAAITKINWVPRHSFYLYLPICILLPSTIGQTFRDTEIKLKFRSISHYSRIAIISLVILNIFSASNYFLNSAHWRDDYRSTAQYLIKNRQASEQSVLFQGTTRLLEYYGDNKTIDGWRLPSNNFAKEISTLTKSSNGIFVVINREFNWKMADSNPESVEEKLSVLYTLDSKQEFENFNIYHFKIRS